MFHRNNRFIITKIEQIPENPSVHLIPRPISPRLITKDEVPTTCEEIKTETVFHEEFFLDNKHIRIGYTKNAETPIKFLFDIIKSQQKDCIKLSRKNKKLAAALLVNCWCGSRRPGDICPGCETLKELGLKYNEAWERQR